MSTYQELLAQAEELRRQAEEARKAELAAVIAEVKEKITKYGITPTDLGWSKYRGAAPKRANTVKYIGPNGEKWAGGRGRKPLWVHAILDAGGDIEQYRVAA